MSFGILLVLIAVVSWAWFGLKKLPVGWEGQRLFLGKRIPSFVKEGWRWAAWPWDIKAVDCRKVVVKLDPLSVFTKDNVLVDVEGSYVRRIANLDAYFGVDDKEISKGLDDLWDQEIRSRVIEKYLVEALGFQVDLGKGVQPAMTGRAVHWGIEVPEVLIASIRPNAKVAADLELKERERLQKDGQRIEIAHFAMMVNLMMNGGKLNEGTPQEVVVPGGLTREQAVEQAQIALGQLKKETKAQAFSLDPATAAIIAGILGRK